MKRGGKFFFSFLLGDKKGGGGMGGGGRATDFLLHFSGGKKYAGRYKYNMRNIFFEKSYTKCGGKTIPRPFFKKSKLNIYLDQ